MKAEQAIFTSLSRAGKSGYHLVSRSAGITESIARMLARWSPSHGGLSIDEANRSSLNYLSLGDGHYALSRSCEGAPEYSGRGGRQVYTHWLVFEEVLLAEADYQPVSLYRAALAVGLLRFRCNPEPNLPDVTPPRLYPSVDRRAWAIRFEELLVRVGRPARHAVTLEPNTHQILQIPGDRIDAAECLLGSLRPELVRTTSLSTSLVPSPTRPFQWVLTG